MAAIMQASNRVDIGQCLRARRDRFVVAFLMLYPYVDVPEIWSVQWSLNLQYTSTVAIRERKFIFFDDEGRRVQVTKVRSFSPKMHQNVWRPGFAQFRWEVYSFPFYLD